MENLCCSLTSTMTLTQSGIPHVPPTYVLPPSQRASPGITPTATLPIIDLSTLHYPLLGGRTIHEIKTACKEVGLFQVINHGIPSEVLKAALDAATEFFDLPMEEKTLLWSDDVHAPVRYGTSLNHAVDKVHFWRDFIKLYCHPIAKWIDLWPSNPPSYRQSVGKYAEAVQVLQKQLLEIVLESVGLERDYLHEEIEEGSRVMAVNCYPACPEPEIALGMPPHSDYGLLTILLQSCQGLQLLDRDGNWLSVPATEGTMVVELGDQIEVISNGKYKSAVHRVTVSTEKKRLSMASLHSLSMDKKVGPAPKLVSEEHQAAYREFSFKEFLDYVSRNDITTGRFIDTLKKN